VALITLNAAAHLDECLAALAFADHIVLIDGGSQDDTVAIARRHNATVHVHEDWHGFGVQKNRAVAALETDWILVIDADEIVSPELAQAIRRVSDAKDGPAPSGKPRGKSGDEQSHAPGTVYALDRLSSFCGHWVRHSGWRPDAVPRLFRRGTARFSDDRVHERLVFTGPAVTLPGVLLHYSYDDIAAVLRKLDSYSAAGAQQRFERGASSSFGKAVTRGLWAFLRTYFLRRGFLDGQAGFMIAVFNAETVYYRFLRLAALHHPGGDAGGVKPAAAPPGKAAP
jgi:glycosyltransferase involved in cell wall biosynthesis